MRNPGKGSRKRHGGDQVAVLYTGSRSPVRLQVESDHVLSPPGTRCHFFERVALPRPNGASSAATQFARGIPRPPAPAIPAVATRSTSIGCR